MSTKSSTHVAILQNISEHVHFITIIVLLLISLYCPNLSIKTCKIRLNETKITEGVPKKDEKNLCWQTHISTGSAAES